MAVDAPFGSILQRYWGVENAALVTRTYAAYTAMLKALWSQLDRARGEAFRAIFFISLENCSRETVIILCTRGQGRDGETKRTEAFNMTALLMPIGVS